ncbi:hypothetical protein [Vibrio rotiferianus]|uniref:hypothetical protein n=1 Tax=Vibrio rotiferianus TaxID=190895 RepID=UPI00406A0AD3
MQVNIISIRTFIILTVIFAFYTLGSVAFKYNNSPIKMYAGVWKGEEEISINGFRLKSRISIIIESNNSRISINNAYGDYNYAYDATLFLRQQENEFVHVEIQNKVTNGLEKFIDNTGIPIQAQGTLLFLKIWRLDEGELFLEVQLSDTQTEQFLLKKTPS